MLLWAGELGIVCFLSCTGAGEKAASRGLSHYAEPIAFLGPMHSISRVAWTLTGDYLVYGIGDSFFSQQQRIVVRLDTERDLVARDAFFFFFGLLNLFMYFVYTKHANLSHITPSL